MTSSSLLCSYNCPKDGAICLMLLSCSIFAAHSLAQTFLYMASSLITYTLYQYSKQDEDICVLQSPGFSYTISPVFITRWLLPTKVLLRSPILESTQLPTFPPLTSTSATLLGPVTDSPSSSKPQTSQASSLVSVRYSPFIPATPQYWVRHGSHPPHHTLKY
jgi:hypothetical protein